MIQWITSSQCRLDGVQKGAEEKKRYSFMVMLSEDRGFFLLDQKARVNYKRRKKTESQEGLPLRGRSYLNTSGEPGHVWRNCLQRLQCHCPAAPCKIG